jgi:prevent-host-death family protein
MTTQPEINQRQLREKSKDIMDAVEQGQAFTVTRDGHRIGELVPIRHPRRFVSRSVFAAGSRSAPGFDVEAFRRDQDAAVDLEAGDPYAR